MKIDSLDHLVLTVADIDCTIRFYEQILGMQKMEFGEGRIALAFGQQKINLHQHGQEFEPKANQVQTGSADLCFITTLPLSSVIDHIKQNHVTIIEGPVNRTGAAWPLLSIYIRDPDGNLLEISNSISAIES